MTHKVTNKQPPWQHASCHQRLWAHGDLFSPRVQRCRGCGARPPASTPSGASQTVVRGTRPSLLSCSAVMLDAQPERVCLFVCSTKSKGMLCRVISSPYMMLEVGVGGVCRIRKGESRERRGDSGWDAKPFDLALCMQHQVTLVCSTNMQHQVVWFGYTIPGAGSWGWRHKWSR
jgi:hypothetical protein